MFRAGNQCVIEQKSSSSRFKAEVFIERARKLLPEIEAENGWIRSGLRIREPFKDKISSYRLVGSAPRSVNGAGIELLLVKTQAGVDATAAASDCIRLVCEHLAEDGLDLAFAALVEPAEDGGIFFIIRSPRLCGLEIPADILDYMCVSALKRHLHASCGISDAMLDGYFSQNCALFDDSEIAARAKDLDKSLRSMKFCDPATGSGQVARAMANAVAEARLGLNRYLGNADRSCERFFAGFLAHSLYACDSSAGALTVLKMQAKIAAPGTELAESHLFLGNVLTDEPFKKTEFDVVASNPPHARLEQFSAFRDDLTDYRSAGSAADLYCYYAERAFSLCREHGTVALLTSNRWMRAGYGAGLRGLLNEKNVAEIVDYGDIPAVAGSAAPLSIITAANEPPEGSLRRVEVRERNHEPLPLLAEDGAEVIPRPIGGEEWTFETSGADELVKKIFSAGTSLGEYAGGGIFRGLLTGLNKAFVLDAAEARGLIERNSRNAVLLKPFLTGRNVKRYTEPAVKKYLIAIPRGMSDRERGARDPEEWLVANYPDIARHLAPFEREAAKRRDKGDYWWELRSCRYYDVFADAKIICPSIVRRVSAVMDKKGLLSNDKTSVIASDSYYLLGLLNSALIDFCARRLAPVLLNDYYELKPALLSSLPIREINPANSYQVKLYNEVELGAITLSKLGSAEELSDKEKQQRLEAERSIDRAVFKLYRLSPSEISMVLNN